jgi:hypothetical protein
MEMSRRGFVAGSAAALIAAQSEAFAAALQENALVSAFAPDRRSLTATRVFADAARKSKFETVTIKAETLGNSPILQFLNRKATAVAVYSAPAGHEVPLRTLSIDGPELLFIIDGASTITTDQGPVRAGVGALVLLEGGNVSEKAGAEGYTVIKARLGAS